MWHAGSLSRTMRDLPPWPGIEPGSAILGVEGLRHWTSRKVPEGIQFNPWHRVLHKTQRNITRLHGRKPAGTKTACPCLAKVACPILPMSLFVCFILCVTVCVCSHLPLPFSCPLCLSLFLHIVWFSLLRVPSGQASLCCHPFSLPSRFKHPPVVSSETLNSKFLGDSPQDFALIPYLPFGRYNWPWPEPEESYPMQSSESSRALGRTTFWRKGKGVKNKQ